MKGNSFLHRGGLILSAVLLLCVSCYKPEDTGIGLLPDEDLVEVSFTDTFTIQTQTLVVDSVRTSNLSRSLIGEYYDEEFGRISAGTFSQFRTTGDNVVFGSDPSLLTLDSLVLTLDLEEFYGRYEDPLKLEIFQITEEWSETDTFFSNSTLAFDSTKDLGNGHVINFNHLPGFLDFISIKLDDELGNKILLAPIDSLVNNVVFTKFFKGIYIRGIADPSFSREPGAIYSMDMLSSSTTLTLYYKDNGADKNYSLRVKDNTPRFHKISRNNFQSKLFGLYSQDTSSSTQYNFLQAGNLVKLIVNIPYLANISPVGVNKAELILKVDPQYFGSQDRFEPPARIFAFHADSTGIKEVGTTLHPSGISFDKGSSSYHVDLNNNIMQIINGVRDNFGFIFIPEMNGVSVNRAVLGGPGHPALAPQLRVTYTEIPQ